MSSRDGARGLPVRTPGIVSRALDDEFVVIHPGTQEAHSLSGLVAQVWAAIDGAPMPVASEDDIDDAIGTLYALDLVQPSGLSRRSLLKRGSIVAVGAGVATIVLPEALAAASPTFSYHTPGAGRFVVPVPAGIKVITYVIVGAGGGGGHSTGTGAGNATGGAGGNGGTITGKFTVASNPSGFNLIVCAGAPGNAAGTSAASPTAGAGGVNAKANVTGFTNFTGSGGNGKPIESGGGGAASYLAIASGLVAVAGGGGGGGDSLKIATPLTLMNGGKGGDGGIVASAGGDGLMGSNSRNKTAPTGGGGANGATPGAGGKAATFGTGGVKSINGVTGSGPTTGAGASIPKNNSVLLIGSISPGAGGGGYAGGGSGAQGALGLAALVGFDDSAAGGGGGSSIALKPTGVTLNSVIASSVVANGGAAGASGTAGSIILTGTTH